MGTAETYFSWVTHEKKVCKNCVNCQVNQIVSDAWKMTPSETQLKKNSDNRVLNLNSNYKKSPLTFFGNFSAKKIDPSFCVTAVKQKMKFDYFLLIQFDLKRVLQWENVLKRIHASVKTKDFFVHQLFDYNRFLTHLYWVLQTQKKIFLLL